MTNYKLGKLYEAFLNAARLAADPLAFPTVRLKAEKQCGQAADLMLLGIDDCQAQLLDWARDNGYPSWETVLAYAVTSENANRRE
jgi:hypothetical protein